MKPRLFIEDDWYAFQTAPDIVELFHPDMLVDNGSQERYTYYCTVTWSAWRHIDLSRVDRQDIPWKMLRGIFEGKTA